MGFSKFMEKKGGTRRCRGTTSSTKIRARWRQELSSCGENSTNESKATFFCTVMYSSFEGSNRGGWVFHFLGWVFQLFTWSFSIHKESLHLYPRIISGVLAVSYFLPCDIGQYTRRWVKTVFNSTILHFLAFTLSSSIFLLSFFSFGRMQKRRPWQFFLVIFVSHYFDNFSAAESASHFSTLPFCCIRDKHCRYFS